MAAKTAEVVWRPSVEDGNAENVEVVEYLLSRHREGGGEDANSMVPENLDELDVQGRALHVATHTGHAEVVLLLNHAYE
jgi:hypothetical protein